MINIRFCLLESSWFKDSSAKRAKIEKYKKRNSSGLPPNKRSTCLLVQSLSHVWFFVTPWTAALQASLSSTICWSLLKLKSFELVTSSKYLILCRPLSSCLQSFPASEFFSRAGSSHQLVKVLELQLQHLSFQWIFSNDFL